MLCILYVCAQVSLPWMLPDLFNCLAPSHSGLLGALITCPLNATVQALILSFHGLLLYSRLGLALLFSYGVTLAMRW